jgi:hypothetical protein
LDLSAEEEALVPRCHVNVRACYAFFNQHAGSQREHAANCSPAAIAFSLGAEAAFARLMAAHEQARALRALPCVILLRALSWLTLTQSLAQGDAASAAGEPLLGAPPQLAVPQAGHAFAVGTQLQQLRSPPPQQLLEAAQLPPPVLPRAAPPAARMHGGAAGEQMPYVAGVPAPMIDVPFPDHMPADVMYEMMRRHSPIFGAAPALDLNAEQEALVPRCYANLGVCFTWLNQHDANDADDADADPSPAASAFARGVKAALFRLQAAHAQARRCVACIAWLCARALADALARAGRRGVECAPRERHRVGARR